MLTEKEIKVLKLKRKRLTQNEIAKKLGISQPAISSFYNNALKKIKDAGEILKIKKKLKLGQGAIEFMILFGAVLVFFTFFFGAILENISDKNSDKEVALLQSVTLNARDEINLAAGATDGYYREFLLPNNIFGRDYIINITDNFVYTLMDDIQFAYEIADITGTINKGLNNITKKSGVVYLNQ